MKKFDRAFWVFLLLFFGFTALAVDKVVQVFKTTTIKAATTSGITLKNSSDVNRISFDSNDTIFIGDIGSNMLKIPKLSQKTAIFGNPANVPISLPATGGTVSFSLGGTNGGGLFLISLGSTGAVALFFAECISSTVTKLAGNALIVSGAPTATQVGVTCAPTNATVTITNGSSRGVDNIFVAGMSPYI